MKMTRDAAIKHLLVASDCSECAAIATMLMGHEQEPLPSVMLEALDITREAVAAQVESEALALLRELNDALAIPGWLQSRVDAVLDRAEREPTEPAIRPTEEAANAFWRYWERNGVTHVHGYYESTWGAINAALRTSGVVQHCYGSTLKEMLDSGHPPQEKT